MNGHNPLRILLVEDNPINLLMAQGTLAYLGHQVTTAGNGQEAVDAYRESAFDLILMDLTMPIKDGYQASSEILSHARSNGQPEPMIVALSANLEEEEKQRCREHGVTRWLNKPISPDEFQELTRSL